MTKEEKRVYDIAYWNKNKEKKKLYYSNHKPHILKYQTHYRAENKEKIKNYQIEYNKENKEYIQQRNKEYSKKYYTENKNKIQKRHNAYFKTRKKYDLNFKLAYNLRTRISHAINRNSKGGSTIKDLGWSIDQFKQYISLKFQTKMSWKNYGQWHLDHIIPLSSFNLTDRPQFLKACHYTNYQPLWATDNFKKGNKILWCM